MKSSGYQCCSMCTISGKSMEIIKETKSTHTESYLPNEKFQLRTNSMWEEDAAVAEYFQSEVFLIFLISFFSQKIGQWNQIPFHHMQIFTLHRHCLAFSY